MNEKGQDDLPMFVESMERGVVAGGTGMKVASMLCGSGKLLSLIYS